LSRRETEVARLAARGARNTEIAASLFLSPKTVEQHLSRVFTKLDVRNRAELGARYADQLG
jgi:DNA-binding NarL/FixJ family response regulator